MTDRMTERGGSSRPGPEIVHGDTHDQGGADEDVYPLPDEFNPHGPRSEEVDSKAAARTERQIAAMFTAAALLVLAFAVAFVAIRVGIPKANYIQRTQWSNILLGGTLGLSLLLIGVGIIQWAKKLMAEDEYVQERHVLASSDEERAKFAETWQEGVDESAFVRRPLLRRTLLLAVGALPIPAVMIFADLGPLPHDKLRTTLWQAGERILIDVSRRPLTPADLDVGGLISAIPARQAEIEGTEYNTELAKSAVILVRMRPEQIRSQQGENWDVDGILAFSKICTHAGCPTALYEQQTHHLLCPCHQSTFDLSDSGRVVFGPAARDLPQLAITTDSDGYLVARLPFQQPVGPSFWERG